MSFVSMLSSVPFTQAYDPSKVNNNIKWPDVFYMEGNVRIKGGGWIPGREVKLRVRTGAFSYKTIETAKPNTLGKIEFTASLNGLKPLWLDVKSKASHPDSRGQGHFYATDYTSAAPIEFIEIRWGSFPDLEPIDQFSDENFVPKYNQEILDTKYEKRTHILKNIYMSPNTVEIESIFINGTRISNIEDKIISLKKIHKKINPWR